MLSFNVDSIETPAYVVDEGLLIKNLEKLRYVAEMAGCKILLAQKAFSMFHFYPLIGEYLSGTTASGLHEARLGHEEMGGETHIFSAAFTDREFDGALDICSHIVFNSFSQWVKFKKRALNSGKKFGIRINPEISTQGHAIYDPCSPGSRLGVTRDNFRDGLIDGITGLHFHTLCEQNSDDLATTLSAAEDKFGNLFHRMEWVNFGGGHHITREDYDIDTLIRLIKEFKSRYSVEVYLEPGEAVALNTGFLVSTVIDIVENDIQIAILDSSATCHMPDVLEMPYRPHVIGSGLPSQRDHTYRLGGPTCLAGDVIGDYSFDSPLQIGSRLVFTDMAHYTMVKTNTFNGINLPSIAAVDRDGNIKVVREFSYEDFKGRLS